MDKYLTELRTFVTGELIAEEQLTIGDGYRAKNTELSTSGIPFARAGNINSGFHFDNAEFFPLENLQKVGSKVSRSGDVVFTSKGTVGRFAFVDEYSPQFVYSPQLCYWRSLNHNFVYPRFLFYWMQGTEFWQQASGVKGQTDMADYVSLRDQRRMHVTLPPNKEQRAIAEILGALDDKIELNRQMNRTLEQTAQALFRSWFMDFDPVVAKADGRQPYGMDVETAALFPDGFENSDAGPIPAGWRYIPLTKALDVNPKRSLAKQQVALYLDMQNMPVDAAHPTDWSERAFGSGTKFVNGDTLLARITPCLENGKTALISKLKSF